ncbi:hypothetical protein P0Y35_18975, partial [Kiritimatiellaeota bacterium B1221]|nr:hypothetical protein [Kiritimatiellaeota bacterium B1221]
MKSELKIWGVGFEMGRGEYRPGGAQEYWGGGDTRPWRTGLWNVARTGLGSWWGMRGKVEG